MASFNGRSSYEGNKSEKGNVNFKAVFTGATLLTPIIFNPTIEQKNEIRNFGENGKTEEINYDVTLEIKDSTGKVIGEKKCKKVSLMSKFNPIKLLPSDFKQREGEAQFAENYYLDFEFLISSNLVVDKTKTKALMIDSKMNSGWVPLNVEKAQELYDAVRIAKHRNIESSILSAKRNYEQFLKTALVSAKQGMPDVNYGIKSIDENSCRIAREGEEVLCKLIFDMSNLVRIDYKSESEMKKLKEENAKKYQRYIDDYASFDMSDVEYIFDLFLAKDYDKINKIIFEELANVFKVPSGDRCKFGAFLGARLATDGKIYQSYYQPKSNFGTKFTFKKPYENYAAKEMKDFTAYGSTIISREMAKGLLDEEYGYKENFQNSFVFKPFYLSEMPEAPQSSMQLGMTPQFDEMDFPTVERNRPVQVDTFDVNDLPF